MTYFDEIGDYTMDKELKEKFELVMPILDNIQDHYNQRDKYIKDVLVVRNEDSNAKTAKRSNIMGNSVGIAILLGLCVFAPITFYMYMHGNESSFFLLLAAVFISWLIIHPIVKYRTKKQIENDHTADIKIAEIFKCAQAEEATIKQIYLNNRAIIDFFPPNYRYSYAMQKIYKILLNRRADTLKEAINVFENDEHNIRMESRMNSMLQIQRDICTYIAGITPDV